MNSPTDKLSPQMTDDERRDYYAPNVDPRQPTVREACAVVALCVMIGAFVWALIWLWRA